MTHFRLSRTCALLLGLALAAVLSAQTAPNLPQPVSPAGTGVKPGDPGRLERLRASLEAKSPLVPGVNRGWEGDPRGETWVTRCDKQHDANACWLEGLELAPNQHIGAYLYPLPPDMRVGLTSIERGCEYGSGEACADLGDYIRFSRNALSLGDRGYRTSPDVVYSPDVTYGPYVVGGLKDAAALYKHSCELDSAYGCYVWAEFVDRGIGQAPDHALARSRFEELCSAGLKVGCMRSTQEQASTYPYKIYSVRDSTCNSDQDCWNQCAKGEWAACDRLSRDFYKNFQAIQSDSVLTPKSEYNRVRARACAEGVDWGCRTYAKGPTWSQFMATGCKAGSVLACFQVCSAYIDAAMRQDLNCDSRFPSNQLSKSDGLIATHMRECFEGGARGCFDFMPGLPVSDTKMHMSLVEGLVFNDSAPIFMRMECNSGWFCGPLADYFQSRNLDPQRGWAYLLSTGYGDPKVYGFLTPIEQMMARGWLNYHAAVPREPTITPDVESAIAKGCEAGSVRACSALGDYFTSYLRRFYPSKANQDLVATIIASAKNTQASQDKESKRCEALSDTPPLQKSGDVYVPSPRAGCIDASAKHYDKLRGMDEKNLRNASKLATSIEVIDPALQLKALRYWALACNLGDSAACRNYSSVNALTNTSFH